MQPMLRTKLETEKVNYLTHFIGMVLWVPLTVMLLLASSFRVDITLVSFIYGASVFFLFYASSSYHKAKTEENGFSTRRSLDHFAIFVMIAGSYTPIVYLWFIDPYRWIFLGIQWGVVVIGFVSQIFLKSRNRVLETSLYLGMGWVAVWVIKPLFDIMPTMIFLDLVYGGVFFTIGAIIYALKKPNLVKGKLGFHELFHILILAGAICHFSMIYRSVLHFSSLAR